MLSGDFSLGSPIFARKRYFFEKLRRFPPVRRIFNAFSFRQRLFGVFSEKRQSGSTRSVKSQKSREFRELRQIVPYARALSAVGPIRVMFSRICDRRANFRRAFADFSLFDRIFRVFADSLPQSRRSRLFKRVFRRFTSLYAPVKENSMSRSQASI